MGLLRRRAYFLTGRTLIGFQVIGLRTVSGRVTKNSFFRFISTTRRNQFAKAKQPSGRRSFTLNGIRVSVIRRLN